MNISEHVISNKKKHWKKFCEPDAIFLKVCTYYANPMTARHYFEGQICNKQSTPRHSEIEVV